MYDFFSVCCDYLHQNGGFEEFHRLNASSLVNVVIYNPPFYFSAKVQLLDDITKFSFVRMRKCYELFGGIKGKM